MIATSNPFQWRGARDRTRRVRREDLLEPILRNIARGDNVLLIGGLGTGKSILLEDVRDRLLAANVAVALLPMPPVRRTIEEVLRSVLAAVEPDAEAFDRVLAPFVRRGESRVSFAELTDHEIARLPYVNILQALLDARSREQAVLIFDELDQYVASAGDRPLAQNLFNLLEQWTRALKPRLVVVAAGGLGVLGLRTLIGSDFAENAREHELRPLTDTEVDELAEVFVQDGRPLTEDVRQQLRLLAGGHPALTVHGLQEAWDSPQAITPMDMAFIYSRFTGERPFVEAYWRKVSSPALSDAARRVLEIVTNGTGLLPLSEIRRAIRDATGEMSASLEPRDVLRLLISAGLVRVIGSRLEDPLRIEPISSILHYSVLNAPTSGDIRATILIRLIEALAHIHRFAADFFHGKLADRKLVPEANLAAFLAVQLLQRGWDVEREALRVAGRTDLLAQHGRFGARRAVVETKIWPRNDYKAIHAQVLKYWATDVDAGVAVMFAEHEIKDWASLYKRECLDDCGTTVEQIEASPPVVAHFRASSVLIDGRSVVVDHLLLYIPR